MKKMIYRVSTVFIMSLLAQAFPCVGHAVVSGDVSLEAYILKLDSIFNPEYTITSEISLTDPSISTITITRVTPGPESTSFPEISAAAEKLKSLIFNVQSKENTIEIQPNTIASVFTNNPGFIDIEINGPILFEALGQLSSVTDPLMAIKSLKMKSKMGAEIRFSLNEKWWKVSQKNDNIKIEKLIFPVFDSLLDYTDKPDFTALGLEPILIPANFFNYWVPWPYLPPDYWGLPLNDKITDVYKLTVNPDRLGNWSNDAKLKTKTNVFAIDDKIGLSNWRNPDPDYDAKVMALWKEILQGMRALTPDLKVGIYSWPPCRDYWVPVKYLLSTELKTDYYSDKAWQDYAGWWKYQRQVCEPDYQNWQKANDRANDRAVAILENIDILYPSLYTFYDFNPTDPYLKWECLQWELYALGNILEARRLAPGKPVYVFIQPRNVNSPKPFPLLNPDLWKRQLEVVHKYADGVVLWDSGSVPIEGTDKFLTTPWDENIPWWNETKTFLNSLDHLTLGDVSGNDEVTAYDAALASLLALKLPIGSFITMEKLKAANVDGDTDENGNDLVISYDAALIAQRSVGLIDKFPVEEGQP